MYHELDKQKEECYWKYSLSRRVYLLFPRNFVLNIDNVILKFPPATEIINCISHVKG